MAASVPENRINLLQGEVEPSRSVRAVSWVHPARLHNFVSGRGEQIVPCHAPMVTVPKSTASTFRYWYKPRYQTTRLRYSLLLTAIAPGSVAIEVPSGTSVGTHRVEERRNAVPLVFDVDVNSQSTTEAELNFKLSANAATAIDVESVSIASLPRTRLAQDANDLGSDRLRYWPRRPITEASLSDNLIDYQNELRDSARRTGFQCAFGDASYLTFNSGSYVDIFDDSFSVLGRFLYSSDTTRTYSWRVLVYCTDGTTAGTVRLTNDAGTATITVPAGTTTATWLDVTSGAASTFSVDAEDNTTSNGLRGAATDDHTIAVIRTAGTGDIRVESISIYEV